MRARLFIDGLSLRLGSADRSDQQRARAVTASTGAISMTGAGIAKPKEKSGPVAACARLLV
jgi:hypothetical protein